MTCPLPFEVEATDGAARAGLLHTRRGTVPTPVFMPVGTQGAIRTLSPMHVASTGTRIVLANTYHLHQRPGEETVARHGGLHAMTGLDMPILTDSGGFQVFSLEKKRVDEDGVTFRYEVDGKETFLSPERSMEIQHKLGADIAMAFDECLPHGVGRKEAEASVARTGRWARRSIQAHVRQDQSLFGIVQGAFWRDLRIASAEEIQGLDFDGYAIGGLSVGEGPATMREILSWTLPAMSRLHPRYLMGVGRPQDIVEGVAMGVDMFDCVIPTRHARSGLLYTTRGRIRITGARYRRDLYPPDRSCGCYTCRTFSRAYLHHLFRVGEVLGAVLATHHNIHWFRDFMDRMRRSIVEGRFERFRERTHELYPERGSGRGQGRPRSRRKELSGGRGS